MAWHVIALKPGLGRLAEQCLGQQGFTTFFPRLDGRDLFTSYAFVQFEMGDPWEAINGTRGVRHLLPLKCEEPVALDAGFIDGLREMLLEIDRPPPEPVTQAYAKGDMVAIVSGPLSGYKGLFVARRNRGWAVVSTHIFGASTEVIIRPHQLKLVGTRSNEKSAQGSSAAAIT